MFKAKAELTPEELAEIGFKNENGYITGYFVDGFIVGPIVEVNEKYMKFKWWIPVHSDTLERIEIDDLQ